MTRQNFSRFRFDRNVRDFDGNVWDFERYVWDFDWNVRDFDWSVRVSKSMRILTDIFNDFVPLMILIRKSLRILTQKSLTILNRNLRGFCYLRWDRRENTMKVFFDPPPPLNKNTYGCLWWSIFVNQKVVYLQKDKIGTLSLYQDIHKVWMGVFDTSFPLLVKKSKKITSKKLISRFFSYL